ncbi:unnamed protein product [Ixodes hexagonus]
MSAVCPKSAGGGTRMPHGVHWHPTGSGRTLNASFSLQPWSWPRPPPPMPRRWSGATTAPSRRSWRPRP